MQPLVHLKLLSKLCILSYFSKTWLTNWRKSWLSSLFWWNRSILQIFFCCMLHLLLLRNTTKPCMSREKLFLWYPPLFFPWNTSDYLYLLKIIIRDKCVLQLPSALQYGLKIWPSFYSYILHFSPFFLAKKIARYKN